MSKVTERSNSNPTVQENIGSTVWNSPDVEAARIGLSVRTLARWRSARVGPPWFRVLGRIRYRPHAGLAVGSFHPVNANRSRLDVPVCPCLLP